MLRIISSMGKMVIILVAVAFMATDVLGNTDAVEQEAFALPVNCTTRDRARCPEYRQIEYMLLKGCKPVYKEDQCCAEEFECPKNPSYSTKLDSKCFCNGRVYKASKKIPAELPDGANCHCFSLTKSCDKVKCEKLNPINKWEAFKLNSCCPHASVNDTTHAAECMWRGRKKKQGQIMHFQFAKNMPSGCQKCICSRKFAGPFGPNCKREECGYHHRHKEDISKGCVPVFRRSSCCAHQFFCPGDKKIELEQKHHKDIVEEKACHFGHYVMPIGAKLKLKTKSMVCKCVTPPDILCFKTDVIDETHKTEED